MNEAIQTNSTINTCTANAPTEPFTKACEEGYKAIEEEAEEHNRSSSPVFHPLLRCPTIPLVYILSLSLSFSLSRAHP